MAGKQSRQKQISVEGEKTISELKSALESHCKKNTEENKDINARFVTTDEKLDKLMPLVDLIPTIQSILERENEQKAVSKWMVRIGRILGFIAATLTAIGIIISAAVMVIKAIIDIKG